MLFFTQVETVGDKYMTVSGLPEPCTHHAKSICHLALEMLEIAGQVKVDDEPVQVGLRFSRLFPKKKKNPVCAQSRSDTASMGMVHHGLFSATYYCSTDKFRWMCAVAASNNGVIRCQSCSAVPTTAAKADTLTYCW